MKILLVSSFLPYPLTSGGHIRLFNLIKELSSRHQITLICEKRNFQRDPDIQEIKKFCETVITVRRKKQWSISNILKSGFSQYPFLLVGHTNLAMKQAIKDVLREKTFDLIHVETFYVMQNLPKTYLPIVLVEHNIEYLVYKRFVDHASVWLRPLLYFDVLKMKRIEEYFWTKSTQLVAVSEEEKNIMQHKAVVVPNGVDIKKFAYCPFVQKEQRKEKRVLFIGNFKWIQNVKAVEWILQAIWPTINLKLKAENLQNNLKLWIVGGAIPEALKKLGSKDVIFDEQAPAETEKIYHKAFALLAPIQIGGGTSYKILEAMATGLPVVTTALGAKGIGAMQNRHLLIKETSDELANGVIQLLQDSRLYQVLSGNARKLIEQRYQWSEISKRLEQIYLSVVNK